tara:strand:- start:609 stop:1214 length:606 start_codon:yes stop_codon:yes gene_type:complete
MIGILDYKMGNLGSVQKALKRLDIDSIITNKHKDLIEVDKIILPGVGNFKEGIKNLNKLGLTNCLNELVIDKKIPILGICLGMQLLCNFSEEGNKEGLGWINADVIKFNFNDSRFKIPHMGWNTVEVIKDTPLLDKNSLDDYYFVHSFYIKCNNPKNIIGITNYKNSFVSVFNSNNIYGTQFHPEKSHMEGLKILKNFSEL